jgi:hypothetical protein
MAVIILQAVSWLSGKTCLVCIRWIKLASAPVHDQYSFMMYNCKIRTRGSLVYVVGQCPCMKFFLVLCRSLCDSSVYWSLWWEFCAVQMWEWCRHTAYLSVQRRIHLYFAWKCHIYKLVFYVRRYIWCAWSQQFPSRTEPCHNLETE